MISIAIDPARVDCTARCAVRLAWIALCIAV
jgi:hypothetical protein